MLALSLHWCLSLLSVCAIRGLVNFTASFVRCSVVGQVNMPTMPASNTESCAEDAESGSEAGAGQFKGYRKRWSSKNVEQPSFDMTDDNLLDDSGGAQHSTDVSDKKPRFADREGAFSVVDCTTDELVECPVATSSDSTRSHKLERDALLGTHLNVFKYPWEKGRLAKVFGSEPLVKVPDLKMKPGGRNLVHINLDVGMHGQMTAQAVVKPAGQGHSTFMQVVKNVEDVDAVADKQQRRRDALQGFWCMLAHSLSSSTIGLKVSVEATPDTVNEVALQILDAVFAVKSPGTLYRRLYSLQSYEQWCVETFSEHWIPVSEMRVWQYTKWLQSTNAAPTKAGSFLEALRFAWFLLGVHWADEAQHSLRVKGQSAQMKPTKKPWRPADLLRLDEVVRLHSILEGEQYSLGDRVMTGHILHLLYSRSRWSDLCRVSNLYIDSDQRFLELTTREHKSARSAELKSKLLPLVAPCKGVTPDLWAVTYMKVRKMCNLESPGDEPAPMMRAPLNESATSWTRRALTSEEGADFMRRILEAPKTVDRRIATHSCKSTLISWTSKYGLSDNARAVLARHMSCVNATTAVYSRDLLSPVLRELENMLQAIRSAMFQPDRSRSGMVTPSVMPVVPGTPFQVPLAPVPPTPGLDVQTKPLGLGVSETGFEVEQQEVEFFEFAEDRSRHSSQFEAGDAVGASEVASSPDSETTEDDSVQSTSDSDAEQVDDERPEFLAAATKFFMNSKSLVIHCERTEGILKCGRRVSPHFVELFELHGIRCSRCFDI